MKRNQILVVSALAVLCIGIYLFGYKHKPAPAATPPIATTQQELNIEAYIDTVNQGIADKAIAAKVAAFTAAGQYDSLINTYIKLDKPLAVAFYSVKRAEKTNNPADFIKAGDYNGLLLQTAPDDKARQFLTNNLVHCYQQASQLDSTATDYQIRLASAYIELTDQPMNGVGLLLNIVRTDSNNVDAQYLLGRYAIVSGQLDKAIARLEKVLYLQPQNSEAMYLLAEVYKRQGNKQKALEWAQKCRALLKEPAQKEALDKYIEAIKKNG